MPEGRAPFGLSWWPCAPESPTPSTPEPSTPAPNLELEQLVPIDDGPEIDLMQLASITMLPFSPASAAGYLASRMRRWAVLCGDVGLAAYQQWLVECARHIERDFSLPPPGLGGVA